MIIADTERFVFIHNPKVGGMTFRTALKPYDTRDNFFFEWQQIGPAKKHIDMAHITLAQLREFFPEVLDQVAPYFKFGFVRNPYTRFLSAVSQHLKLGTPHTRAAILREPDLFYRTASSFALTVLDRGRIEGDHRLVHFREQGDFFYLDGAPWANCILKLEEPEAIAATPVAAWLGDATANPKNRTEPFARTGYDLAALSPPARDAIARFYAHDFKRFGYSTDLRMRDYLLATTRRIVRLPARLRG